MARSVLVYNVSGFSLFYFIISYSGHTRGKKAKDTGKGFEPYYCVGLHMLLSRIIRYQ